LATIVARSAKNQRWRKSRQEAEGFTTKHTKGTKPLSAPARDSAQSNVRKALRAEESNVPLGETWCSW
jgi:hypothetical protein